MPQVILVLALVLGWSNWATAAEEYTIHGQFEGCEYGKLYELDGGRILECLEYNYFYEYAPLVIARNDKVLLIADEQVDGRIHVGRVATTSIIDDFDGCEFGKVYRLLGGLLFECNEYRYSYSYAPEVKLFAISGRPVKVMIDGEEYSGRLFGAN